MFFLSQKKIDFEMFAWKPFIWCLCSVVLNGGQLFPQNLTRTLFIVFYHRFRKYACVRHYHSYIYTHACVICMLCWYSLVGAVRSKVAVFSRRGEVMLPRGESPNEVEEARWLRPPPTTPAAVTFPGVKTDPPGYRATGSRTWG